MTKNQTLHPDDAALKNLVRELKAQNLKLQKQVAKLQAQNISYKNQITALRAELNNRPHITLEELVAGANVNA